jgi:16S rRNA A1518/A1519 N6-dimethyltransferase RsmA/KsgA/DIM1 with predicted DNA glycosylase/AP lyase activity
MVDLDVAYIPTPKTIVRQMLSVAGLRKNENLYDLGAGDGRILVEGVRRFGAKATGVEIDPDRIERLRERLQSTGVVANVIQGDLMNVDVSSADVIAIYLSDPMNERLAKKLERELKPGARVVSLDYTLPGWRLEKEIFVKNGGLERKLFLYIAGSPPIRD